MTKPFENVETIVAPTKKGRKAEQEILPVLGLEKFAALVEAGKKIAKKVKEEEIVVKKRMLTTFISKIVQLKGKPDNFKGVEGIAEASCQLKVRSAASSLSESEREILIENGIPFATNVSVPEAFLINPKYNSDMTILKKIEKALSKLDLPSDIILRQEAHASYIVTDETLNEAFKLDQEKLETVLPIVMTPAISSKLNDKNFWGIIDEAMKEQGE